MDRIASRLNSIVFKSLQVTAGIQLVASIASLVGNTTFKMTPICLMSSLIDWFSKVVVRVAGEYFVLGLMSPNGLTYILNCAVAAILTGLMASRFKDSIGSEEDLSLIFDRLGVKDYMAIRGDAPVEEDKFNTKVLILGIESLHYSREWYAKVVV